MRNKEFSREDGDLSRERQAPQQRRCAPEPGPVSPFLVARHGWLFIQNALRPLARLPNLALCCQEICVVVIGLGQSRNLHYLGKERRRFLGVASLGIGMGQKTCGAMKVIGGVLRNYAFEVRQGRDGWMIARLTKDGSFDSWVEE